MLLPQGSGLPAEAAKPAPSSFEINSAYEAELLVGAATAWHAGRGLCAALLLARIDAAACCKGPCGDAGACAPHLGPPRAFSWCCRPA